MKRQPKIIINVANWRITNENIKKNLITYYDYNYFTYK